MTWLGGGVFPAYLGNGRNRIRVAEDDLLLSLTEPLVDVVEILSDIRALMIVEEVFVAERGAPIYDVRPRGIKGRIEREADRVDDLTGVPLIRHEFAPIRNFDQPARC